MGVIIWLLCVAFLQIVFGQVGPFTGQNVINSGQRQLPFTNTNVRGLSNPQQSRGAANGVPAANQFARNAAINGNSLANTANTNIASANSNLGYANSANANFAGQHLAINIASTNLENANYANLGYADPNLNFGNLARPELGNQVYSSSSVNPITHTNIAAQTEYGAGSYVAPNAFNSNYGNLNAVNCLGSVSNPSVASNFGVNLATDGNNIASALNNLANGLDAKMVTFKIGDNPFQVISGSPGNHQLGLHIVADALEVGGTVSVAGKMPIYGTVTLNGSLPTDGMASVNYGCTSHPNA